MKSNTFALLLLCFGATRFDYLSWAFFVGSVLWFSCAVVVWSLGLLSLAELVQSSSGRFMLMVEGAARVLRLRAEPLLSAELTLACAEESLKRRS